MSFPPTIFTWNLKYSKLSKSLVMPRLQEKFILLKN